MNAKTRRSTKFFLTKVLPYIFTFVAVVGLVFVGSAGKSPASPALSMSNLAANNFEVSTDQLSEFYMVASVADAMRLSSSDIVANNYVAVSTMYEAGQTGNAAGELQKQTITDTSNFSRGIVTYVVQDGETIESIINKRCAADANACGVTVDQIRWSNGLKTASIAAGQSLFLPNIPGIVYEVKSGDALDSVANKTSASATLICQYNDLENADGNCSELIVGMRILIPNGVLPNTERPEYVAPVRYAYTYSGSSSSRQNLRVIATRFYEYSAGNPGVPGQCTWYAWWWRANDPRSLGQLPGGLGNANAWARQLASVRHIDRTPEVGAVFQTTSGWYGHVGVVLAVNDDGSITVREMNYGGWTYRIVESEIPANLVGSYNYIH